MTTLKQPQDGFAAYGRENDGYDRVRMRVIDGLEWIVDKWRQYEHHGYTPEATDMIKCGITPICTDADDYHFVTAPSRACPASGCGTIKRWLMDT